MKYFFIFFIVSNCALSQNNPCDNFYKQSIEKIRDFSNKMTYFEQPYYLSKKELFSIVSPEYITFSESKNKIEVLLIKSNLYIKNDKFDLSFGPFQMKISFIINIINKAPLSIIKDPILLNLKNNNDIITAFQIDYLNKIETQWKLLRMFEYCYKNIYNQYNLSGLYSIYNRGGINKKKAVFNKIKCTPLSYEDWCSKLLTIK